MPKAGREVPLDPETARAVVAELCWPVRPDAVLPGAVGLECEAFAIAVAADGRPAGRAPLSTVTDLLDGPLAPLGGSPPPGDRGAAGWVTLEPGAQVEHATRVHQTAGDALAESERAAGALAAALGRAGVVLASAGLDLWHPLATVPQQLTFPRYPAMEAYFALRGGPEGPGAVMMRHSCAFQVNLDLGPPEVAAERWLVAALAAPMLTASFSASPTGDHASGRAAVWLELDPTRTGFPAGLVAGRSLGDDPVGELTAGALDADVLLFLDRPGDDGSGGADAGVPGFSFADWMRDGHPVHGRPDAQDLAYHLTTLWPEVRVRGFLEIRTLDALPARWRAVPVVLLTGLLYDDRARGAVRDLLERHAPELPRLARRAARTAVADPELCALAVETWSLALAGARRLPEGFSRPGDFVAVEAFLERFTLRGRCPADELRERLAASPAAALAWASEPVETLIRL